MQPNKRAKINKILLIVIIVLVCIAVICGIVYAVLKNKSEEDYEDKVTAKDYFVEITVDLHNKIAKRDGNDIKLTDEFGISEDEQNLILSSETELQNYFADSTFDVDIKDGIAHIKNKYQTKRLLIETDPNSTPNYRSSKMDNMGNGVYILTYDTQKKTKAAYDYLSTQNDLKNLEIDQVSIVNNVDDVSQTVYGEDQSQNQEENAKTLGITEMGLNKFQNVIQENGNPSDVVISTIGYGAKIDDQYFAGRIADNYYNFMDDTNQVTETIPQGSRILEVLQEATTHNVKLLPLEVVNNNNYTTTSAIIRAIKFATENSDVICYEMVNTQDPLVDIMLKNAFQQNKPVCCATVSNIESDKDYPANNSTTMAISSLNSDGNFADYSGKGQYVDFSAYSTDVEEVFDQTQNTAKWSGPQYSNAHIVAAIALIKTYHKDYTILDIYNFLRNWSIDLGDQGKDDFYGYGVPDFSKIKISDLDNTMPEIQEIIFQNDTWEKKKSIQIKASDNIRILSWAITESDKQPTKWNKLETLSPILDVTTEVTKNGKYYIWVQDSAGNAVNKTIEINKIDNNAPTLNYTIDDSKLSTENTVTIKITAKDDESGLNQNPFSFDKNTWSQNTELKVNKNGKYKIYAKDNLDNIAEKEVNVNKFPQEGTAKLGEGSVIKEVKVSSNWSGNKNNSVQIIFNDNLQVQDWKITESGEMPEEFYNNQNETGNQNNNSGNSQGHTNLTITTSLNTNTDYYLWAKDINGNVMSQSFKISKKND